MIIRTISVNFLIIVHVAILFSLEDRKTYENYKIYHVFPSTLDYVKLLTLLEKDNNVDFLNTTNVANVPVEMLVKPEAHDFIFAFLKTMNISFVVSVKNVSSILPEVILDKCTRTVTFRRIMRLDEIERYLTRLAQTYKSTVSLKCFTKSPEGRCINLIKISGCPLVRKPIIVIEAGMHGREWIAPAQALYVIHQLVENPQNYYLIKDFIWHIIPVFNPDGYEYSHTTDVFWRKTRNNLIEPDCIGVDPNRNFPFKWYQTHSTMYECSGFYSGPHSLSTTETFKFKDYLLKFKKQIRLYLSFHSHGNHILYPWGYTDKPIQNKDLLHGIAANVTEAMEGFGKYKYTIGSFNIISNNGFGLSTDWAMSVANIKLVYTIILPSCGPTSFHPKGDEILPIVDQMFEGIKKFTTYVQNNII